MAIRAFPWDGRLRILRLRLEAISSPRVPQLTAIRQFLEQRRAAQRRFVAASVIHSRVQGFALLRAITASLTLQPAAILLSSLKKMLSSEPSKWQLLK